VRAPDADDLLRRLGRGVRPIGGAARSRVGADTPDFTMLLSGARSGAYRSGRRVGVPGRFDIELSDEQREELDRAGDEAEAGGLGVFAAVVADRALLVDVGAREVFDARPLRDVGAGGAQLVHDAQGLVVLTPAERGDDDGSSPASMAPALRMGQPARFANASLVRSLGGPLGTGEQSGE